MNDLLEVAQSLNGAKISRSAADRLRRERKGVIMSVWEVQGADQSTGKDRTVRVAAPTAEAAEKRARAAGMLISSVRAAQVSQVYHPPAGAPAENHDTPTPAHHLVHIPNYTPILMASALLRVFAAISVIAGIVTLAYTIYAWVKGNPPPGTDKLEHIVPQMQRVLDHTDEVKGLILAGAMLISGIFLYAVGNICLAIRDIARNSFSV